MSNNELINNQLQYVSLNRIVLRYRREFLPLEETIFNVMPLYNGGEDDGIQIEHIIRAVRERYPTDVTDNAIKNRVTALVNEGYLETGPSAYHLTNPSPLPTCTWEWEDETTMRFTFPRGLSNTYEGIDSWRSLKHRIQILRRKQWFTVADERAMMDLVEERYGPDPDRPVSQVTSSALPRQHSAVRGAKEAMELRRLQDKNKQIQDENEQLRNNIQQLQDESGQLQKDIERLQGENVELQRAKTYLDNLLWDLVRTP
jgi:hypothetical protein